MKLSLKDSFKFTKDYNQVKYLLVLDGCTLHIILFANSSAGNSSLSLTSRLWNYSNYLVVVNFIVNFIL